MEKLIESIPDISSITSTNTLNSNVIEKIKSYMRSELFIGMTPVVITKKQTTTAGGSTIASSLNWLKDFTMSFFSESLIFNDSLYVEPKGRSYYTTGEKPLTVHVNEFFKRGEASLQAGKSIDKKVCVILGDPGCGKTTFGKYFMREAFKRWELNPNQYPIPLWIPLSRLKLGCDRDRGKIYCDLLTYLFKYRMQLADTVIQSLQQQRMQIFIDSYDEINYMGNLYRDNRWDKWPKVQFVIASRPEKFRSQPYSLDKCMQLYFSPNPNNLLGLSVYTISPLDNESIQEFIKQWVSKSKTKESITWSGKEYWQTIDATPNIKLLAANPVMLTMLLHTLPEIAKEYSGKNEVERYRLGQLEIYKKFISTWFKQQEKRIKKQLKDYPHLEKTVKNVQFKFEKFTIMRCLHTYTENLAYRCLLDSPDDKLGIEISTKQTLLPSLFSQVPGAKSLVESLSGQKSDDGESYIVIWLKLLRSGCLLRCDANYFAFFHKSLVEYLTQQHLFNDASKTSEVIDLESSAYKVAKIQRNKIAKAAAMNGKLLVKEHNLISMLAKQAQANSSFCKNLYYLVTCSCQDQHVSTAAANAITILNCAKQPLNHSDRDWRNLKIPGADLSYAILEGVQWQGGDLRNVNFCGAYLKDANFNGARLLGCQWPIVDRLKGGTFFKVPVPITRVVYTWDRKLIIMGDEAGKIFLYSTITYKCVQVLKQYYWYSISLNYPVKALAVDGGINNKKSDLLASATSDEIYLWSLPKGKYLGKILRHKNDIDDLQLTENGEKLLSHGVDGSIFLWNTKSLKLIRQFKLSSDYNSSLYFIITNDIPFLIKTQTIYIKPDKSSSEGTKKSRKCKCYFQGAYGHVGKVNITLTHDEMKYLELPGSQNKQQKENIVEKIGYREFISPSAALSPSGRFVVFIQADGQLNGYAATNVKPFSRRKTPRNIAKYLKHIDYLRFSPDERYIAACGSNGKIILWSIETDENPVVFSSCGTNISQLVFAADGKHLAVFSSALNEEKYGTIKSIEWINLCHGTSQLIFENNGSKEQHIALSADSSQLALSESNEIILLPISSDIPERKQFCEFLEDSVLTSQSKYIIPTMDKKIDLYLADTGILKQSIPIIGNVIGSSSDEKSLFVKNKSGIYQYFLKSNHHKCLYSGEYGVVFCSPTGKHLVQIVSSKIYLSSVENKTENYELSGHECKPETISWSPDGLWFASCGIDKFVYVWPINSSDKKACFSGHRGLLGAIDTDSDSDEGSFNALGKFCKFAISGLDVPLSVTFSPDNRLVASASGGYTSYTVFIYTREGRLIKKLVQYDGIGSVLKLKFNHDGQFLAVFKMGIPFKTELHLWDWKNQQCIQQITLTQGWNQFSVVTEITWIKNTIRILFSNLQQCRTYYKGKNDRIYRLSRVVGLMPPNASNLSLQGTRGLTKGQYQFLKAQAAIGKPKAFARIVDNKQDVLDEKKELTILKRCRKGLTIQAKHDYACSALFEPQKHISTDRWHVTLFRIVTSVSQVKSNNTNTTQSSTSQAAIDFHTYGFIEGLDAAGRSVMIQFDLVEDRNCPKYARIKHKCLVTESLDLKVKQNAFLTMFNREKNLPTKLCIRIAGTLNAKNRDQLLDTIIEDQKRQFESQDLWSERRIRYKLAGGSEKDNGALSFSANCLTWLRRILKPYKLNLPHSIWDNITVNPKYTLSESGYFRNTSCVMVDVSGWDRALKNPLTKSFK